MSLIVKWQKDALRDLENLEFFIRERVSKKINEFALKGSYHEIKYLRGFDKMCRLRVGNYRVLFQIRNGNMIIFGVGHRKNIY